MQETIEELNERYPEIILAWLEGCDPRFPGGGENTSVGGGRAAAGGEDQARCQAGAAGRREGCGKKTARRVSRG